MKTKKFKRTVKTVTQYVRWRRGGIAKVKIIVATLCLLALICGAQITNVITTGGGTNILTVSGSVTFTGFTIPGVCTNVTIPAVGYTRTETNAWTGEPLVSAFGKINGDLNWITSSIPAAVALALSQTNVNNCTNFIYQNFVLVTAGQIMPSNTWSTAAFSNYAPGAIWFQNSNGVPPLFGLWQSPTGAVTLGHFP